MYLKTETESVDKNTTPQEISILEKLKLKQLENETDCNDPVEKADSDEEKKHQFGK